MTPGQLKPQGVSGEGVQVGAFWEKVLGPKALPRISPFRDSLHPA